MKTTTTSAALALLLGLGLALPAAAQQTGAGAAGVTNPEAAAAERIAADADTDQRVTAEEATAHGEQRFGEVDADRSGALSREEYTGAMTQAENPAGMFDEVDRDGDGGISREEWTTWRQMRWAEAAAGAEGLTVEDYETFDFGGAVTRR